MLLPQDILKPKKPWTDDFIEGVRVIVAKYDNLGVEFKYEIFGEDQEQIFNCQNDLQAWHEKKGQ